MAKTFLFELITPQRQEASFQAEFAALPAHMGEMGVLPGHAPALAMLQPGTVRVTTEGVERRFAVSGGFAEVLQDRVSLFAETAEMAEKIDAERARQALERAKAELLRKDVDPMVLAQAEAALKRARARLKAVEGALSAQPHRPHPPAGVR